MSLIQSLTSHGMCSHICDILLDVLSPQCHPGQTTPTGKGHVCGCAGQPCTEVGEHRSVSHLESGSGIQEPTCCREGEATAALLTPSFSLSLPISVDHEVLVPGVAEAAFLRLLHRWWSPRVTVPACIFGGKLDRLRSPLPTPNSMEKTGGEQDKRQTGQNKPFPTKMTTDGSFGSLWHLLLMDGCLQPFCALRTLPSPTDQASLAWYLCPAPTDGRDGRGGPPSQATSPQISAASHQRQPRGPLAAPTDSVCQRQEAGGGHTTQWAEEARGSRPVLALLGTDITYRYFGTPGGVLRPASISALWPLSLRTSFGRTHLSMQFVPTPPRHERPRSSRPSGLPSHMESISTLRNRGEGTGPPTPRFLEAGGAAI